MRYFLESLSSWAYWRYVLFSRQGIQWVLSIFGAIYLFIEALDFFSVIARDQYGSYAFFVVFGTAIVISVLFRRPTSSIVLMFPQRDFSVEVRISDIFEVAGAVVISTNTEFEADVAGGKISPNSLQGQFTARYFTGSQQELIDEIQKSLAEINGTAPYSYGTTVPITTHGKTFYFVAMSSLNDAGNATTTPENVKAALSGLWAHVREAGELQELAVPLIGTGRGRLKLPRRKVIEMIAQSFVSACADGSITDRLVIVVSPDDATKFAVNLYDIKDHLRRSIVH